MARLDKVSDSTTLLKTETALQRIKKTKKIRNNWLFTAFLSDLNKCYSGPCDNGGSCVGNKNEYTCICLSDWAGKNCETKCECPLEHCYRE